MQYNWPGNVRELENCVKSAALLTLEPVITEKDLRLDPPKMHPRSVEAAGPTADWRRGEIQSRADWEAHEREAIVRVLVRTRWNKSKAAIELGMSRRNLYRKLARYGIEGADGD